MSRPRRVLASLLSCLVVLVVLAGVLHARPGGGNTFSTGTHSSSSSSSSSGWSSSGHTRTFDSPSTADDDISGWWIAAFVGGLLLLACLVALAFWISENGWPWPFRRAAPAAALADSVADAADDPPPPPRHVRGVRLAPILAADPAFSLAVFEDLAFHLYAAAQRARGAPARMAALAPYLAPGARQRLAERDGEVEQVAIGALSVVDTDELAGEHRITVRYAANLAGAAATTYAIEEWTYARAAGRTSSAPVRAHTWPCPSCGAPWQAGDDVTTCAHCGQAIAPGKLTWAVVAITVESEATVGPTLTETVAETGTDLVTIAAPQCQQDLAALTRDDPNVTWTALGARIALVYKQLNTAWNDGALKPVRGLVTASLRDYLAYWLDEYKRQKLHNHLTHAGIERLDLAKVRRDRYFDAITVRVFATGTDYTTAESGRVVTGSKTEPRPYTEYWTFLRASARRGPVHATAACPNCGGPLAISDEGDCEHCSAHVETGDFDWILSKIEQDETYRG